MARSPGASRYRHARRAPTPLGLPRLPASSTCSPTRKIRWAERLRRAVRPHHRHRARRGEDHARQPRLQYRPPDVSRTQGSHRTAASGEGALREKTSRYAAFKSETQRKMLSSRRNRRQRHVDVGAQILTLCTLKRTVSSPPSCSRARSESRPSKIVAPTDATILSCGHRA